MKLAILGIVIACGVFGSVLTEDLSEAGKNVDVATLKYGCESYKVLAKRPGNILLSPISSEALLALLYTGAAGNTATEMATALKLPKDQAAVSTGYHDLSQQLIKSNSDLKIGNKIYVAPSVTLEDEFKKNAETNFDATIEALDFSKAKTAADTINAWVEAATNKKITNSINEDMIDESTIMFLINAVYFFGKWQYKFELKSEKLSFYVTPKQVQEVPKMFLDTKLQYKRDLALKAEFVQIPYTNGYVMTLIVPFEVDGLQYTERRLSDNINDGFSEANVVLTMPKFKIQEKANIKRIVTKLGMEDAFGPRADFSKISKQPLTVSRIVQDSYISVDENGTEAAAKTEADITDRMGGDDFITYQQITADHPFIFMIQKVGIATPIFIGRYQRFQE